MKVMIVDDSQTMVRILSTAATKTIKDVEVFLCYNGQEALDTLTANPDVKLVLLDVNMPVMSGKEFLEIIRKDEKYDNVRVIMQTTESSKSEIKQMMELGITGYLMKPYQTAKVIELMTQLAPIVGYEVNKD
jgi:CheY-like chemotaxis protein